MEKIKIRKPYKPKIRHLPLKKGGPHRDKTKYYRKDKHKKKWSDQKNQSPESVYPTQTAIYLKKIMDKIFNFSCSSCVSRNSKKNDILNPIYIFIYEQRCICSEISN
jgi:hypothetical protein